MIDATQGIQAQTISNLYMAIDHNLEIIPVLNKMDMINAMPEEVKDQIVDLVGCNRTDIIEASAKTGMGIDRILTDIVTRIPPPPGRSGSAAAGFDLRFNIQFIQRDHCLFQNCERNDKEGRQGKIFQHRA